MPAANRQVDFADLHEALLDLTRVVLAVSGEFTSKSEAVRKLSALAIPPSRIASIMAIPATQVTSVLAKAKKAGKGKAATDGDALDTPGE